MSNVELIPVTHDELTTIIREIPQSTPVKIAFGTDWAALKWDHDGPMPAAIELLGTLRGIWLEQGAGI
jgi:hypothetical protein